MVDPNEAHLLTKPRVSAVLAFFGPSSAGLALMSIALNQRNVVFWLGFAIASCGVAATLALYSRELRTFNRATFVVLVVAAIQAAIPTLFLFIPQQSPTTNQDTNNDPRRELAKIGVPYTGEAFDEAVRDGQLDVLTLFLKAGYSPNRLSETDYFSLTEAIIFNNTNFTEEFALLRQYGLDFKKMSPRFQMTQEEEAYYQAALSIDHRNKILLLKEAGADPTSFLCKIADYSIPNPAAVAELQKASGSGCRNPMPERTDSTPAVPR